MCVCCVYISTFTRSNFCIEAERASRRRSISSLVPYFPRRRFRSPASRGKLIHVMEHRRTHQQNGASYVATRSRLCARLGDKSLIIANASCRLSIAPITGPRLFPLKRKLGVLQGFINETSRQQPPRRRAFSILRLRSVSVIIILWKTYVGNLRVVSVKRNLVTFRTLEIFHL